MLMIVQCSPAQCNVSETLSTGPSTGPAPLFASPRARAELSRDVEPGTPPASAPAGRATARRDLLG